MERIDARRRRFARSVAAAATLAAAAPSHGQPNAWPTRPFRILVGFPPGGLIDAYARLYAEQLAAATGQAAIVENRPGAGSIIAMEALARAAPDGCTLAMSTSSAVLQNRVLYRRLPYDPDRDLVPVSLFPGGPLVMAVAASSPVRSVGELIERARAAPVPMGTYGPGSQAHMVADSLRRHHGAQLDPIHYKGEAPMWIDLGSGAVQVAIGSYSGFQSVAGKGLARALAVTGSHRSPKLPEIPTLAQAGLRDRVVALDVWGPLLAPAGTPEPVLARLAAIAVEGAGTPRAAQLRDAYGIPDTPTTLEQTRRRWAQDGPVWIELARELGISLD